MATWALCDGISIPAHATTSLSTVAQCDCPEVYLKAYGTVSAARAGIAWYFDLYRARRPHQACCGRTPECGVLRNFGSLPAVKRVPREWMAGLTTRRARVRGRRRPATVENPELK